MALSWPTISSPMSTRRVVSLGSGNVSPLSYCLEGAAHAKVDVQHHCCISLPKEVEQVLAMYLNAGERLLIDGLSTCTIGCSAFGIRCVRFLPLSWYGWLDSNLFLLKT